MPFTMINNKLSHMNIADTSNPFVKVGRVQINKQKQTKEMTFSECIYSDFT